MSMKYMYISDLLQCHCNLMHFLINCSLRREEQMEGVKGRAQMTLSDFFLFYHQKEVNQCGNTINQTLNYQGKF